jgi:ClpP class serine protease
MAPAGETGAKRSWLQRLGSAARLLFWLLLIGLLLLQVTQPGRLSAARAQVLERFQDERKSRVIALIHRQEAVSVLGVPVASYIDINDSEAVLRAIRLTPPEQPIDVILHTPGGLVLAAEQIARALAEHKGKVTVFVPHYAMSGGTLIALAADGIVMDPNAVLGPVDPQIGELPAASVVKVLEIKKPDRVSDLAVIMADMAQKARVQVNAFVTELLLKHYSEDKAKQLATTLSEGRWTHDYPITVQVARALGIQVSTEMPRTVYDLMDLYPQAQGGRPSVLYVPLRRGPGGTEETPASPPSKSSDRRG